MSYFSCDQVLHLSHIYSVSSEIEVFFFSCATFLYQKSLNFKNFVDDPYMLLGNMYKTFTKTFTISNGEEFLIGKVIEIETI